MRERLAPAKAVLAIVIAIFECPRLLQASVLFHPIPIKISAPPFFVSTSASLHNNSFQQLHPEISSSRTNFPLSNTTTTTTFKMSANDSTLKSYIDYATGAAQNALGNLTGNTGDQAQGQARKEQGKAEHDLSHATAKVPGGAVSGSGAAVSDDPNRTQGSWNQTMGSAKEAVGGLLGNEVRTDPASYSYATQHITNRYDSLSRPPAVNKTVRANSRRPRVSSTTSAPALPAAPRVLSAVPLLV